MSENQDSIVVEQLFAQSRMVVWNAITDHPQMIQWFFDNIPDFKAEVGFETRFDVDSGERVFPHVWKITEVIPGEKIVYDWTYDNFEGQSLVTFILADEGEGCKLKVISEGMDSFTADIPEFSRAACQGGWEHFIQGNLKNYMQGK